MLSDADARAIRAWIEAADVWARTAQALVGAATELATVSRDIAVAVDGRPTGDGWSAADMRQLADEVERDTTVLRDAYLATAANMDQYRQVLDD